MKLAVLESHHGSCLQDALNEQVRGAILAFRRRNVLCDTGDVTTVDLIMMLPLRWYILHLHLHKLGKYLEIALSLS